MNPLRNHLSTSCSQVIEAPARRLDETYVARPLAPEEIRLRDRVVVLREIHEFPSFLCGADASLMSADKTVRIARIPDPVAPPVKVKAVCLPLVFAVNWKREVCSFDVRLVQLARVDPRFAKSVWKALRRAVGDCPATTEL